MTFWFVSVCCIMQRVAQVQMPTRCSAKSAISAEPEVGEMLVGFVEQTRKYRDLRSSCGFDEVETEKGLGFIGWEFAKYDPTADLKLVAMEVARLVATDKYQPGSISVAAELPSMWLSRGKNADLEKVLAGI